jgi:hypothetical protein
MPIMLRYLKPKKIAFSILGTPCNIKDKRSSLQKKIDEKLLYQNTQFAR